MFGGCSPEDHTDGVGVRVVDSSEMNGGEIQLGEEEELVYTGEDFWSLGLILSAFGENIVSPPGLREAIREVIGSVRGWGFHYDSFERRFKNVLSGESYVVFSPDAKIIDITNLEPEELAELFPELPKGNSKEVSNTLQLLFKEGPLINPQETRIGRILGAGLPWVRNSEVLVLEVVLSNGEKRTVLVRSSQVFNAQYHVEPHQPVGRRAVWVSDQATAEELSEKIWEIQHPPRYKIDLAGLKRYGENFSAVPVNNAVPREITNIVTKGRWIDHAMLRGHKLDWRDIVNIIENMQNEKVAGFLVEEGPSRILNGGGRYSLYTEVFIEEEGGRISRSIVSFHFEAIGRVSTVEDLLNSKILPTTRYVFIPTEEGRLPYLADLISEFTKEVSENSVKILGEEGRFVEWGDDIYVMYRFLGRVLKTKLVIKTGEGVGTVEKRVMRPALKVIRSPLFRRIMKWVGIAAEVSFILDGVYEGTKSFLESRKRVEAAAYLVKELEQQGISTIIIGEVNNDKLNKKFFHPSQKGGKAILFIKVSSPTSDLPSLSFQQIEEVWPNLKDAVYQITGVDLGEDKNSYWAMVIGEITDSGILVDLGNEKIKFDFKTGRIEKEK